MLPLFARADGAGDALGKFERGAQRPCCAASSNRLCNLKSKPFFAIIRYDLPHLIHTGLRQPIRHRGTTGGVHPHVERAVPHERETTLGIVDLRRGNAQINITPSTVSMPRYRNSSAMVAKPPCTTSTLESSAASAVATAIAWGSLSNTTSRACGPGGSAVRGCDRRGRTCRPRRRRAPPARRHPARTADATETRPCRRNRPAKARPPSAPAGRADVRIP